IRPCWRPCYRTRACIVTAAFASLMRRQPERWTANLAAPPSRAQFHRWLVGDLRGVPYTEHCRTLEHMITGYSADQLFAPCLDGVIPAPARLRQDARVTSLSPSEAGTGMAGVEAVFATRSEFTATVQPAVLFGGARRIRAAGLSLNLICQQLAEQQLQ